MISISNYLQNFRLMESQSFRALGVGASCYVGLKILKSKHELAPYLSKSIVMTSAIATLHFGGLLEKDGLIRNCVGAGFNIPGMGTLKIGFSANDVILATQHISQAAKDQFNVISKYWTK
jgi:hypothetical protein